jgi:hypothetical protein
LYLLALCLWQVSLYSWHTIQKVNPSPSRISRDCRLWIFISGNRPQKKPGGSRSTNCGAANTIIRRQKGQADVYLDGRKNLLNKKKHGFYL